MKFETIRRWLWRAFLVWTLLGLIVLPFDLGEAQIKMAVQSPFLVRILLGIGRAADAAWLVLAAATMYFYVIEKEGIATARKTTLTLLADIGLVLFLGLKTGFPYGPLIYTNQLGLKISGLPVAVILLWFVLVTIARYTVLHFWEHAKRWQIAFATGGLVAMTDLGLEWVAWRIRGYWLWYFPLANTPDWPPLQNYAAWFCVAAAFSWLAFPAARPAGRHGKPCIMLGLINLLLWGTIALRLGR